MNYKPFPYFHVKIWGILIIGSFFLLIFLRYSAVSNLFTKTSIFSEPPIIATVNGENITVEEFNLFIDKNRAMTYNYFKNKYGIDQYSGDFWSSEFGVEIPIEYIKQTALQECVLVKLQQLVAQERGIVSDINYSSFKYDLAQENARRKLVKKNGGILYGPVAYNTQMYYNHLFSQMFIDLRRDLAHRKFKISEKELKREYDNTRTSRFRNRDLIQAEIITSQNNNEIIFSKLLAAVDTSTELEKLIKTHRNQVNINDMLIDEKTYGFHSRQNERLSDYIYQLMTGQSGVFIGTDGQPIIIRCKKRSVMGFKPFDQVKDLVRIKLINDYYDAWLIKLENQADIRLNEVYIKEVLLDKLG